MTHLFSRGGATQHLVRSHAGGQPTFLIYQMTDRCNARCVMCHIWKKENVVDISVGEWKKIVAKPLFKNVEFLLLTGGEPFLTDNFVERARVAVDALPRLKIIAIATNGLLTQKIIDDTNSILAYLPSKILLSIAVSVDGLEQTHNTIRGVPHAYAKAMATFRGLQQTSHSRPNLTVGIETVINRYNVDTLEPIEKHHRRLTTHFNFTPAIRSDYYKNDPSDFTITNGQKEQVVLFYQRLMRRSPHLAYFYDQAIRFLRSGQRHYPCLGGILTARISPDGALYPCLMLNKKIADAGDDFEQAWFNGPFASFRKKELHQNAYCRCCLNSCDMVNNYYYEVFDVVRFYVRHPLICLRFAAQFLKDTVSGGYYSQMTKK